MNKFVSKALLKIDQMGSKQIVKIIQDLDGDVRMLQTVLDSMRDGVILCRKNGNVMYVSGRCPLLVPFAYRKGKRYEGMPLSSLIVDKELISYIQSSLTEARREEGGREFNFARGDSVRIINVQVVTSDELKGGSFLVLLSDVTDKNISLAKLHQSEYLASMTTMAASIAHEIKNPLGAMSIHVQLMRRHLKKNGSMTEAEMNHYLDVLEEEIERLNAIAVDFLFAVRPMNTKLKIGDIMETVDRVVSFVKPELETRHVTITVENDSSVTRLNYDEKLIGQVLLNLLKNAMNAMTEAGGTIRVSLSLSGDSVLLKVSDTGCGIPEEKLSKIFEPYYTTHSDGTGLGLTIVYKVMKEHKGDVSVQSREGVGSCFTLSFPVPESERLSLPKTEVTVESPAVEVKN